MLWRHVPRRAEELTFDRQDGTFFQAFGEAEVCYARLITLIDQDVRWFEVAVQDPVLVCMLDPIRNCLRVTRRPPRRHWTVRKERLQVQSPDEFQRKVVSASLFTNVIDGNDVWVVQAGCRFCLHAKAQHFLAAREPAGQNELDWNIALPRSSFWSRRAFERK